MQKIRTDLLIIGAGPAGLCASLYAARAGISFEIVEKNMAGGQIINTQVIDNYPGFKEDISGFELIQNIVEHCRKFNINIREYFEVNSIRLVDDLTKEDKKSIDLDLKELKNKKSPKFVCFNSKTAILSRALIVATGASPKRLGVEGESKLIGKGISFCATCDGALYKDKEVAVVGGGNSAIEEAMFLTKFASKVYVIHRRDELRAVKILQEKAFSNEKINFILSSVIEKFIGTDKLEEIIIRDKRNNQIYNKKVDGVFEYVGITPNSDLVKDLVELDKDGFIITNFNMETSISGVFAAGDVRNTTLRQVVTAVADGAVAATSVDKYLSNLS